MFYTAKKYGVRLEFVDEAFDDTPEGRFLRATKGIFADIERDTIRDLLLRGKRKRANAGKMIPSNRPLYGYRWSGADKAAYISHPVTSPVVQRIYHECAASKTLMQIARDLTLGGVLTPRDQWRKDKGDPNDPPRGEPWRRQTVQQILVHPAYSGHHSAFRYDFTNKQTKVDYSTGRSRTVKVRRERAVGEERIALPQSAPALVSDELAANVRERLAANRRESVRNNKQTRNALLRGGYIKCANCGKNMHVHARKSGSGTYYYFCPSFSKYEDPDTSRRCPTAWLNVETTDEQVWAIIYSLLQDPQCLSGEIMRRLDEHTFTDDKLESYDKQIAEIDRLAANLARTIEQMDSPEDAAPFIARAKELGEQRRKTVKKRMQAETAATDRQTVRAQLLEFERWCEAFVGKPELWTTERKRLALYALEIQVFGNAKGSKDPFAVQAGPEDEEGNRITLQANSREAAACSPNSVIADSLMMNF